MTRRVRYARDCLMAKSEGIKKSPWDSANVFSRWFLCFMLPIFRKNYKNELTFSDVQELPQVDQSRILGTQLGNIYNQKYQETQNRSSFRKSILNLCGLNFVLVSLLEFADKCILAPLQVIALGWLLHHTTLCMKPIILTQSANNFSTLSSLNHSNLERLVHDVEINEKELHILIIYDVLILVATTLLGSNIVIPYIFQTQHIGMKLRVASTNLIYKKSLRLSLSSLNLTSVGHVIALITTDVNRIELTASCLAYFLIAPAQVLIIYVTLAKSYVGLIPALISFSTIIGYFIIQIMLGKVFGKLRTNVVKRSDERMRILSEVFHAIQVIKMYTWEKAFQELVDWIRKQEMKKYTLIKVVFVINQILYEASFLVLCSSALITYVVMGNSLDLEIVYVTVGFCNLLNTSLTVNFPLAVTNLAESFISCERIMEYLLLPEFCSNLSPFAMYKNEKHNHADKNNGTITANTIWCSWTIPSELNESTIIKLLEKSTSSSTSEWAVVRNLSFTICQKDLLLIVGRVGSGKSSLLMALLGELPLVSGQLEVNGQISYASQNAWIIPSSVRENILMGKSYLHDRYKEVIRVCALEKDLKLLVDGDATIVGECGVSLSGGQRARVNLARALYANADIYLLDDPLSTVDVSIARFIFNEAFNTFLREKTVVLVTHQLQFLHRANKVLVLDRILPAAFGTLQEVVNSKAFKLVDFGREAFKEATLSEGSLTEGEAREIRRNSLRNRLSSLGEIAHSLSIDGLLLARTESPIDRDFNAERDLAQLRLINRANPNEKDTRKPFRSPTNSGSSINYYTSSGAGIIELFLYLFVVLSTFILSQVVQFFLNDWTNSQELKQLRPEKEDSELQRYIDDTENEKFIIIYSVLVLGIVLLASIHRGYLSFLTYRGSIQIHQKLFSSLIKAPMALFDFNPVGLILNIFSRDINQIDELIPTVLGDAIGLVMMVIVIVCTAVFVDFASSIPLLTLITLTATAYTLSRSTILKIRQMESINRSPLLSHQATTLAGLATIRTLKYQSELVELFECRQDEHSGNWFNSIASTSWLFAMAKQISSVIVAIVIVMMTILSLSSSNGTNLYLGLIISNMINLPTVIYGVVRYAITLETLLVSVQRIEDLSRLKSESELIDENLLNSNENSEVSELKTGDIVFNNVSLRYFLNEPPILDNLSFTLKFGEKLGVLGRTGAGKSSIISILFRLHEFHGSIRINGIDIKSLPLNQLRAAISIMPQEPITFSTSIRKNLDPLNEYDDDLIWSALEAVKLKQMINRLPGKLDFTLQESGSNLSAGQRQLICLARVILKRNQILVLDEITANVDPETDEFIQRTIDGHFAHCTVITIAHRLITIAASDNVLVLEKGQVKEFGPPYELIRNEKSFFSRMVANSTGQEELIKKKIEVEYEKRRAKVIP